MTPTDTEIPPEGWATGGPYYLLNDMTPQVIPNIQSSESEPRSTVRGVALCRCGGSKNKPFCDGTHWHIKFKVEKN